MKQIRNDIKERWPVGTFGAIFTLINEREFLVDFAETVRRYVCPNKGDKFCSRSELLGKLAKLNELINGKEENKRSH